MARHFLLLLLSLLPCTLAASAAPTQVTNSLPSLIETRDAGSCSQTSRMALTWVTEDFHFHSSVTFSTPAHQIPDGSVAFKLTNTALPFAMSCSAYSTQLDQFFYGDQWFACTGPETGNDTTAIFQFDHASGRLDLKQNWVCSDGDSSGTAYFFDASGTTNVTLDCTTEKWENGNWTTGQVYSTEVVDCALQNITVQPSEIEASA
ncbi:hypothetical protein B0T25DRAFT_4675 [Lasiosphaeria hispida]|uniref:AA1-like domain-containing protein n=1 Tax=Lasiosphaeria hispida TaxID=260671 RepID=A0AAJ0HTM0_9PEZI|nr:hypothetical protein B0T25DRAFT_4675 [Lasiosphaeria hispida]